MFRIEMLPAAHGDCLWIEYGSGDQVHRILIDGGPAHTYPSLRERVLHLPAAQRHFDLLVITHIDADHIEGIIRLLQDAPTLNCTFDRIWFNGAPQLNQVPDPAGAPLGAMQGEILGLLIKAYEEQAGQSVWNKDMPDQIAYIPATAESLPAIDLPGDCRLTLLSPNHERLLELKDHWDDELAKAGVDSGDAQALQFKLMNNKRLRPLGDVLGGDQDDEASSTIDDADLDWQPDDLLGATSSEPGGNAAFGSDTSLANGSSIALLLEYPKEHPTTRFLLSGDAWASVLKTSIDKLLPNTNKALKLTGFKLPHHGSIANISPELLQRLNCTHYLISTSGALFNHPHARAVELLLEAHNARAKPRLHFNYMTDTTFPWADTEDQKIRKYVAHHPEGISLLF
ncbi:MAG: hypothetical protein OQL27_13620 [Sedimenticola sp.]|nr:hypothetical protein [Sedimenticola sp.]